VLDRRILIGGAAVIALGVGAWLLWADDGGGSGSDEAAEEAPALDLPPGTIAAVDFDFPVDEVTVASGEPLTFENRGDASHTLTADDGRFDSGVVAPGETFTVTLDGPREIAVHCDIHPTMTATVIVTGP
jgi:plastocyanin